MAKKKKALPKSMEELTKQLEKELKDKNIDKEEFDNALKKILKKPKKPNS